ncbi:hypothetical protein SOVF_194500 [Spinacia oleracea]|nr:hypothetical protein SOVF_194500 [Spinacia oleracea]
MQHSYEKTSYMCPQNNVEVMGGCKEHLGEAQCSDDMNDTKTQG